MVSDSGGSSGGSRTHVVWRLIAVACLASLAGLGWRSLSANVDSIGLPDPTTSNDGVLLGGRKVSLDEAAAETDIPLLRPQAEEASDDVLKAVWLVTEEQPAVAFEYESGVRVYLTTWPKGNPLSPEQFYKQLVSESGAGWTQDIDGIVAWVSPADSQAAGRPPEAIVDFVVDGVEVSLRGGRLSVDDLVKVAESIAG